MSKKASEFQEKVMPIIYRGKDIFKPLNTGMIDEHVKCVREYIVNIFFYTKNDTTIMIDAGYNYSRLKEKMGWLDLNPAEIRHILITHQDTDHVGAVETDSDQLFKDATLYIGEVENRYLTGETRRQVMYGAYKLPMVTIDNPKVLLKDGEILTIDDITVECFLVPGHTWGHMVYLIDEKYLFTGDTIWFGLDGGYSFINMLAEDNELAKKSLEELERKLRDRNLSPMVITGHTGWSDDLDFVFARRDQVCNSWYVQKPHDIDAPYNGYDESDDTEEKARSEKLARTDRPEKWASVQPDYKNWVPQGMINGLGVATGALALGTLLTRKAAKESDSRLLKGLNLLLGAGTLGCGAMTAWSVYANQKFSYHGTRQLSRQIIEGTAEYVRIPDGGTGLDVGCGSGALTIACAKRNPNSSWIGIDRWGKEYASFSKKLCENNARAEGVANVSFRNGDAVHLDFEDEIFDAVTSNYVYHNITGVNKQQLLRETLRTLKKGGTFAIHDLMDKSRYGDMEKFVQELLAEGYEEVRLIPTADGTFMTKAEAATMFLAGSTLLIGKK